MTNNCGTNLPSLFAKRSHNGAFVSDTCFERLETIRTEDGVGLKPIVVYNEKITQLPSIRDIVTMPLSFSINSPSSIFETLAPLSASLSPSSPASYSESNANRKGSVALLLNSNSDDSFPQSTYALKQDTPQQRPVFARKQRHQLKSQMQPTQQSTDSRRSIKGLRHFSKQVCDIVAAHGKTTYSKVENEIAAQVCDTNMSKKHDRDQKNVRRRVYDALNVLVAMGIVVKEKKMIRWKGIPSEFRRDLKADLERQIALEEERRAQLETSLRDIRTSVDSALKRHWQLQHLSWRSHRQGSQTNKTPSSFIHAA